MATATPITDLEQRLRDAGFTEPQARAIASGFEILNGRMDTLDRRMDALERRMDALESRMRLLLGLQLVTLGAVLAPYVAALFNR